ncbi:MAG TPA: outer membrane lipoprotein carrier protein LolA [Bauldia sp.]|nr:outer membrane lipoprotein carrier protein LolA [Bauldia sp.]
MTLSKASIIALAALLAATPVLAAGDSVPLPHLRPANGPKANAGAAAASAVIPPAQVQIDPNSPFTPAQQVALANISAYFNSFSLMEGDFIQIGPNGEQSEGVFFLRKPGRIRFHYNPPARLDVISDGSTVAIKDGRSGTQDMYPLSKTPLRYLLAASIDLTSSNLVNQVQEESDLIMVTIVQRGAFAEGTLVLTFDRKTYELRQWQVTDAQGLNTSVAIFNTVTGKPQNDPNLYRVVPQ